MIKDVPTTKTRRKKPGATPFEAAGLLDVPRTVVAKAIEQRVVLAPVSGSPPTRRLAEPELAVLALLKDVDIGLPVRTKLELARWVRSARPDRRPASLALRGGLTVTVRPEVADEVRRALAYLELRDRWIESDPEIKGGAPVIAGTRISAYGVADRVGAGDPIAEIAEEFPTIPLEAFQTAVTFAHLTPRRGRPRAHRPWVVSA
jgi:uncharacterized protein (DUF433 family)